MKNLIAMAGEVMEINVGNIASRHFNFIPFFSLTLKSSFSQLRDHFSSSSARKSQKIDYGIFIRCWQLKQIHLLRSELKYLNNKNFSLFHRLENFFHR